jgi:hypothetical protein
MPASVVRCFDEQRDVTVGVGQAGGHGALRTAADEDSHCDHQWAGGLRLIVIWRFSTVT